MGGGRGRGEIGHSDNGPTANKAKVEHFERKKN